MRSRVNKYPLISFFILAFLLSWLITAPLLLGTNGLGIFQYTIPKSTTFLLTVLFSFGPLISGLIMANVTGYGAKKLIKSYLRWKVNLLWYVVVFAVPPVIILLGATLVKGTYLLQLLTPGGISDILSLFITYSINLLVLFFIGGPLGEETGWRGFALPRLQERYNPLIASLLLGTLWVMWHLPNFFIPEMGTFQGSILLYFVIGLALSIIHTWLYNVTTGSLLLVTLLHAAIDSSTRTFLPIIFGTDRATGNIVPLLSFCVWALFIVIVWKTNLGKNIALSRKNNTANSTN